MILQQAPVQPVRPGLEYLVVDQGGAAGRRRSAMLSGHAFSAVRGRAGS
jgi:hypothetical protein